MDFFEHGGRNGKNIRYDFSANINPLGLPEGVSEALRESLCQAVRYPEAESLSLREAIAGEWGTDAGGVVCTNGASELIYAAVRALRPAAGLFLAPTFSEYERAFLSVGCPVRYYPLKRENGFAVDEDFLDFLEKQETGSLLFLCNPNNPTGSCVEPSLMERILRLTERRGIWLAVDEAFLAFSGEYGRRSMRRYYKEYENLLVLNAFTKLYAMPGLRLGYGVCESREVIRRLLLQLPAWNVSVPAQEAGLAVLKEKGYVEKTVVYVAEEREFLVAGLKKASGLIRRIYPPMANYIFLEALPGLDRLLADRGIAVRSCENYRQLRAGDYRIAVRSRRENEALLQAIYEEEAAWQKI